LKPKGEFAEAPESATVGMFRAKGSAVIARHARRLAVRPARFAPAQGESTGETWRDGPWP
jgi:hypothetical protein